MATIANIQLAIIGMMRHTGLILAVAFVEKHKATKLYTKLRLQAFKKRISNIQQPYLISLHNKNYGYNATIAGKVITSTICLNTKNIRIKLYIQSLQNATYRKSYFDNLSHLTANIHNLISL